MGEGPFPFVTVAIGLGDMAQKIITIIIFISVDIDNYHDKCHIFISFKFKARFLLQSESFRIQTVRLVPMCLCQCVWAPPLEDKRPPWESTKAVSCICHPGRSTLGESTKLSLAYVTVTSRGAAHWGIHTLYWRSHHFPLPSPLRIHWKIHAM